MATYTPLTNLGALLTSTPASYYTVPGATKSRSALIDLMNEGQAPARIWVWAVDTGVTPSVGNIGVDLRPDAPAIRKHSSSDAFALELGYQISPAERVNIAVPPKLLRAGGQIFAMTDFAAYGLIAAAVTTTAEYVATAANCTYTATQVTDTGAAFTASPNAADLVGRRLETSDAYLIVTSNTGTTVAIGSDGWRFKINGLPYVNPANGNAFPTSATTAYTLLASMRDPARTATGAAPNLPMTQDAMSGHLLTVGAYNARRSAYCAGNNVSIATYGTTFQIVRDEAGTAGGWPTGTPTGSTEYHFDSKVRMMLDYIEES